jgi:acetylornithine deacetylase/succinyl-diaminopimelate desuccinylase-like protein
MNPYEFAEAHREEFLEELKELLRIPSISTMSEHKPDIRRAAEWFKTHFEQIGMTRAQVYETPGNPIVYAEWLGAGNAPTVLIYGHYDVQPAEDSDNLWKSDPFEPVIRDGNLYARGATDDKGQTLTQIKAVQSLLASGTLPVNVKFIVEGEEEAGSPSLYPFVEQHLDMLRADVVVVSDTHLLALDRPSITVGLRGIVYLEIEVRGPSHDLHSGTYGGVVHNPANALVDILAALHHPDGSIAVPGFYDRVVEPSAEERAELAKVPFTLERLKNETGLSVPWGEAGYEMHERLGIRPTCEINGMISGYTGEGGKTVIPAKALAKVSCRLVPEQEPDEIERLIRDYVQSLTPPGITSEVRSLHNGRWAVVNVNSSYMRAASRAYEFGFGAPPVFTREGGSIPIVGTFQNAFNAPAILMGFGLPDDNLHAPNEKFCLECFYRGIRTAIHFLQLVGSIHEA